MPRKRRRILKLMLSIIDEYERIGIKVSEISISSEFKKELDCDIIQMGRFDVKVFESQCKHTLITIKS